MIVPYTWQEGEILCRGAGAGRGHRVEAPCFKLGQKAPFSIFLRLFNKKILKQEHAERAVKSAKIDVF